jgi:endonuclease/exonuclease/phosphatase family metal-dependent hydrolase
MVKLEGEVRKSSAGPRFVQMNLENLFVLLDRGPSEGLSPEALAGLSEDKWQSFSSSTTPNKPLSSLRELAANILHLEADILILSEIGGPESLANFNRLFLNDQFETFCFEGNSNRGIDLGFLARRGLPYAFEMNSHRHRPLGFLYPHEIESRSTGFQHLPSARRQTHYFSRDVLELNLACPKTGKVCLRLFSVHLKSRLDRDRIDPSGRDRRRAEVDALVQILREKTDAPFVLAGDFNGFARPLEAGGEEEFKSLFDADLVTDALEIAGLPVEERFTHIQFWRGRTGQHQQFDYIFVSQQLKALIDPSETFVFRLLSGKGTYRPVPRNLNEKRALPTDHYPVVMTLTGWP